MLSHWPRSMAGVALAASIAAGAAAVSVQGRAQIYATVLSDAKTPVGGLSTADFVLRDGGVRIGVLNAAPALEPLSVAITVSGFDEVDAPALTQAVERLRQTLADSNAADRVGVLGGQVVAGASIAMLSGPAAETAAAIQNAIRARRDPIDGAIAACEVLREAPADRRTVLAFFKRQPSETSSPAAEQMLAAIRSSHAALWTIEIGGRVSGRDPSPIAAIDLALDEAVRASGAIRERVASAGDLPAASERTAKRWLSQYLVTFTWPEPMVSQFSLVTRHDAGDVLTPEWTK